MYGLVLLWINFFIRVKLFSVIVLFRGIIVDLLKVFVEVLCFRRIDISGSSLLELVEWMIFFSGIFDVLMLVVRLLFFLGCEVGFFLLRYRILSLC